MLVIPKPIKLLDMQFSVRQIVLEQDYSDLEKWWKDWKFSYSIPPEMLPKVGLIVEQNGLKICSVFIYQTDSGYCWLNWFLSNKTAKKEQRKQGLEVLINSATFIAKKLGFKAAFITINNAGFESKLKKYGFINQEINKNEYLKVL